MSACPHDICCPVCLREERDRLWNRVQALEQEKTDLLMKIIGVPTTHGAGSIPIQPCPFCHDARKVSK